MKKRDKLARSLLKPINPSIIIILGVYTILWGVWIINPLWTVFSHAALYSAMDAIAPEWWWGSVAIISGLVITRGALKPSYHNLHLGSFVACLHWLAIAILYFAGDWMNTGGITSLTFAFYSGIVWLNVKVNKEHYDNQMH